MENFSTRDQLVELANKLFIYTDERDWSLLKAEVFHEQVDFNMSSLGGPVRQMTAREICDMWKDGFEGIDAINHLAGNHLVKASENEAEVFAYATATHFKEAARNGKTREFVGTYQLGMTMTKEGWRINRFTYTLKYMNGNLSLE